jgi:ketosteroid isomerase-like protein
MKGLREEADKTGASGIVTNGPLEVRILANQVAENGDQWLVTAETHTDGTTGKTERIRIRWTNTGWRLVIGTNGEPVHETIESQP